MKHDKFQPDGAWNEICKDENKESGWSILADKGEKTHMSLGRRGLGMQGSAGGRLQNGNCATRQRSSKAKR